jgi:hypothetical protein
MCNNTHVGVVHNPGLTFWTYLIVRTVLGVLTAASLMMFEGAVMATVQVKQFQYNICLPMFQFNQTTNITSGR